jgi:hypothetical protein
MNRLLIAIGTVLLCVSTGLNAVMIHKNQELTKEETSFRSQLIMPIGAHLSTLKGFDPDRKPVTFDAQRAQRTTVLFVFSPTCSHCAKNWVNWNAVLKSQAKIGWQAVFVNTGDRTTTDFRRTHGLENYTIIEDLTKNSVVNYRLFHTPETIILSPIGEVVNVWDGELSQAAISSITQNLEKSKLK